MSDTKWTKGPWVRNVVSGMGCDVRSASGRKVACTFGVANPPKSRGAKLVNAMAAQKATDDANGHLIAAAPELYEYVQKHYDLLTCVCNLNAPVAPLGAGIECTKCSLAPLLAKARGEACAS